MADSFYALRFLLLVLIVAANAFFASAEVALLTVRESRLRELAEKGQVGAQAALNLLENPRRLLSVTQVGVTLASLGLGWAGEDTVYSLLVTLFEPVLPPGGSPLLHAVSFLAAFLTITYAHVVIGEVVPKNVAVETADRLAVMVAPPLLVFDRISQPFVYVIEASSALMLRIFGFAEQRGGGHSAEELRFIVSSSRGAGKLPVLQEDMIHGVLDLEQLAVREIMVPRNEMVAVPVEATLDQVLEVLVRERHSRLPVYQDRPEQIVGVLHVRDLLRVWQERLAASRTGRAMREFRLRALMRKPRVVPETKPLLQMLEEFKQGESQMALVVDEFGTIVGLLTVEDVLEQIVGEIRDEYDEQKAAPPLTATVVELDGATNIRDLETQYGIEIPSDAGFETLAGFLLLKLGYIPQAGESVEHGGRRYTVLEMQRNRIARVRIEKVK